MHLPHPRSAIRAGAMLALGALLALLAAAPLVQLGSNYFALGDLRAFYCAARVAASGADPYRSEPLGACERGLIGLGGDFVVPAPLPGDAIALFEPLARLPFSAVAVGWCMLLAALFVAASAALARLTSWSFAYVAAALFPLAFAIPVNLGQLVPLAVALLVAAAVALRSNRDGLAAVLAVAATIEPHIGLPACAALWVARPRARRVLAGAALASAALAVWAIGPSSVVEYVSRVLPEHIAAEARFDDQYSLTYLLSWLRVPIADAIMLGQASYWLIAGAGVAAALRLARTTNGDRYLLFVPMAASVIGGPYVHEEHLLAALPLAVVLAATTTLKLRSAATCALVLVAWPAKFVLERLHIAAVAMRLPTAFVAPPSADAAGLADAAWGARIEPFAGHVGFLLAKMPSWIGLALLVAVVAARAARASRAATEPPVPTLVTGAASPTVA